VVGRQNADIADTLHLRTLSWQPLWFLMSDNFSCVIVSDTLFDSRGLVFGVKLSDEDIADFEVLSDIVMATVFAFIRAHNPNGISVVSAVFAQFMAESPCTL